MTSLRNERTSGAGKTIREAVRAVLVELGKKVGGA